MYSNIIVIKIILKNKNVLLTQSTFYRTAHEKNNSMLTSK